jgi:hypothetical protein
MKNMGRLFSLIGITLISAMFSGCRNQLPKGSELKNIYYAHRQEFDRIVTMLKEDGAFGKSDQNQVAALMLNPLGPRSTRDLDLSSERREAYKKSFGEIGLRSPALVFSGSESVVFVIATKGLAIGGGGTTRGIAYIAHPEKNPGIRVVQTDQEAETSTYGGADLVPIEGNWYLYYVNPS